MHYVNRERERVIPINLKNYINSLSIESTSHKDIFTYINKDNVLEYTLESLELDIDKYNRLITNGIRDNDRFILESISFLNNVSLEEGNIFTKIIEGAKKIIKIILDKIVQFFRWIGKMIMKFINWVKGLFKKTSNKKTAEKAQQVKKIIQLHGKEWLVNKNAQFKIKIYDWKHLGDLRYPFDTLFDRYEKYNTTTEKGMQKAEEEELKFIAEATKRIAKMDPELDFKTVVEAYMLQHSSKVHMERFKVLDKLFGEGEIRKAVMQWGGVQYQVSDELKTLDDTYSDLFEMIGIDIEAIEESDGNYRRIVKSHVAKIFFNTLQTNENKFSPGDRIITEKDISTILSEKNLLFFDKFSSWLQDLQKKFHATEYGLKAVWKQQGMLENGLTNLRKAYEAFLIKFEKWDIKKQGHLNAADFDIDGSHVLDTERQVRDRGISPNDKKKIIAEITGEVKALQMINGFHSILMQLFIGFHQMLYPMIDMLSTNLDTIFNEIIKGWKENGGLNYNQTVQKEEGNFEVREDDDDDEDE